MEARSRGCQIFAWQPTRQESPWSPHEILETSFVLVATALSSSPLDFHGGGGPLNHFLRENWNFRQEVGDTIRTWRNIRGCQTVLFDCLRAFCRVSSGFDQRTADRWMFAFLLLLPFGEKKRDIVGAVAAICILSREGTVISLLFIPFKSN